MNCNEARNLWHERHEGGTLDVELDKHLEACESCRRVLRELGRIVEALGDLQRETEFVASRRHQRGPAMATRGEHRFRRSILRPAAGIAAAVMLAASAFFALDHSTVDGPADGLHTVADGEGSPQLGISLQGECSDRFVAVARPTTQPNVQVFWLYPTLASSGELDPS